MRKKNQRLSRLSLGKTFEVVDSFENLSCLVQAVAFQDVRWVLFSLWSMVEDGTVLLVSWVTDNNNIGDGVCVVGLSVETGNNGGGVCPCG